MKDWIGIASNQRREKELQSIFKKQLPDWLSKCHAGMLEQREIINLVSDTPALSYAILALPALG